jgi:hypothetical protein
VADPDGQHGQAGALTTAVLPQPGRRPFRARKRRTTRSRTTGMMTPSRRLPPGLSRCQTAGPARPHNARFGASHAGSNEITSAAQAITRARLAGWCGHILLPNRSVLLSVTQQVGQVAPSARQGLVWAGAWGEGHRHVVAVSGAGATACFRPRDRERVMLLSSQFAGPAFRYRATYRAQDPERVAFPQVTALTLKPFKIVKVFEFMPLTSAPGRIRTCAHGSGVRCRVRA